MNIEYRDIGVRLGKSVILNGVSVRAEDGKMTGIVGPNGCGKSTLIKTLFSMVPFQTGCVLLENEDTRQLSRKAIAKKLGYVGQEMISVFDFTVREVVAMGRFPHQKHAARKKTDEIVDSALNTLGIKELADRSILTISGGEKKLVYLARTIAQEVETIVLDEPTNHLDIYHQLLILDYLKMSGKTILLVLHDLTLAARYCDIIYLMDKGANVTHGCPNAVLNSENIKEVFDVEGQVVSNRHGSLQFELYESKGEK